MISVQVLSWGALDLNLYSSITIPQSHSVAFPLQSLNQFNHSCTILFESHVSCEGNKKLKTASDDKDKWVIRR
jgi:hypothetical protein